MYFKCCLVKQNKANLPLPCLIFLKIHLTPTSLQELYSQFQLSQFHKQMIADHII